MLTVFGILAVLALLIAIWSAYKQAPALWISVVLLAIIELLRALPLGR